MTITLGSVPESLRVELTRGGDFIQTLESEDAEGVAVDWVDGEVVTLVFDTGDVWAATLSTNEATWNVDKAVVEALLDDGARRVMLLYTADGADLPWAKGSVAAH
jgi:hypothetical protein